MEGGTAVKTRALPLVGLAVVFATIFWYFSNYDVEGMLLHKPIMVVLSFDMETQKDIENIPRILQLLQKHNSTATFYVIGGIAKNTSLEIRDLRYRGHEIGCHGLYHEYPIFSEEDAALLAKRHNTTTEYVWERSVKTEENYKKILFEARETIKASSGAEPSSYRSPILIPGTIKDMRYVKIVEEAGFSTDSSILRRDMKIDEDKLAAGNLTIVPASFSDAELNNSKSIKKLAMEHRKKGFPLVIVIHGWRFAEEEPPLEEFLKWLESTYKVRYRSVGDVALES